MNFLKTAASLATAAAKTAAESAKKTYADLKAYPSQVRCSGCPLEVEVPAAVWEWSCPSGHVNTRDQEICTQCKIEQPQNLPEPTVQCQSCQAVTPVPASNARKHAREAATKTKEFAVATAVATKQGVNHLRATPTTFHCHHCQTLLAVPTGAWSCQTCTTENLEESKACKQCGQKKTDQKAICGVCRQSTVIPSSNFEDGLKAAAKDASKGAKKIYYDVAGKPYLTCQKCGASVSVDKSKVSGHAAGAHAPVHAPQEEGAGLGSAPGGAASAGPDAGAEGVHSPHYSGETVSCPACKNIIEGQ